jgi:oxygen-dependent protoporphyrinogen oxidase
MRIAVIGGGIAGLTVALRRVAAGDRVVLFEASSRLGGQLRSEAQGGFVVEHGAEGFVARSEAVPALAADAAIFDELVEQLLQQSFCYESGKLIALAPGEAGRLLGFQVATEELGRGIRSFRRGMGQLPEQLSSKLASNVEFRLSTPVESVMPHASGVTVTTARLAEDFDAVVVATTARSAAALLGEAFGADAQALADASLLSSLTVTLAFRREHIAHPLDGTGFIVPAPEQLAGARAVTFASSKLPERAPEGYALLRVFFRPRADELAELSDAAWVERAERALGQALSLSGASEQAWVSRWPDALPVFDDAHRARIRALERALEPVRIRLAGAAFHGSGIDAAIRSANATAAALVHP